MDKIAVLIPCYNESKTVKKVVEDFRAALPEAAIYVYDNNSSDGTDELAREAGAIVRYEYQQGKGNVIRRMFREIEAEVYVMVDGDDTYPAESAPAMVDKVLNHKAIVPKPTKIQAENNKVNGNAPADVGVNSAPISPSTPGISANRAITALNPPPSVKIESASKNIPSNIKTAHTASVTATARNPPKLV